MSETKKLEQLKPRSSGTTETNLEQLKGGVEQVSETKKLEELEAMIEQLSKRNKETKDLLKLPQKLEQLKPRSSGTTETNLEQLKGGVEQVSETKKLEELQAMIEQLSKRNKETKDFFSKQNKKIEDLLKLPQKKYFRQRAHSNPLSDHELDYPSNPKEMDWSLHYPNYFNRQGEQKKEVEVVDIGCGYGGLLINLANILPNTLSLGMEIRVKVSSYVRTRISKLRLQQSQVSGKEEEETSDYQNIACIRANAMKHMPNFFRRGQLRKAFILFPDPHFKKQKLKWRVVSPLLLAEYAYVLATDALLYTITDVLEVHEWMVKCLDDHPSFTRVDESELVDDPCYKAIFVTTEEGMKVARNGGDKHPAVYRRLAD